ncbi:MAG: carboxypeptidase regulatory-like domain-containing protein, partial [Gammaproteobacteria bacterium]
MTVVDEFGAPVAGAQVVVTVGTTSLSDTTNAAGVAMVASLPTGTADVAISLGTYQTQTANATIIGNGTTSVNIELVRNTQAAGGVFTTSVIGTPTDNGKVLTIELQVVVVDQNSQALVSLTDGDFELSACSPTVPDPQTSASECVRYPENLQADSPYTVDNPSADAFALVPGGAPADYAAALMLDQSGSIGDTDPTNARLYSAKAFMQTVDAGSGDAVLLTAFAGPGHGPLIPTVPLWFGGTFTTDGVSYFDELDALGDQAGGDTPLYRVLYPEPADANNNPGFTQGLIDYTAANAPAGLRKAVVIFSDGDDN